MLAREDVMTPQGIFVPDALRPLESRDPYGVEEARRTLKQLRLARSADPTSHLGGRGKSDATGPTPFYFSRVNAARRFRHDFPLGAPDRDETTPTFRLPFKVRNFSLMNDCPGSCV